MKRLAAFFVAIILCWPVGVNAQSDHLRFQMEGPQKPLNAMQKKIMDEAMMNYVPPVEPKIEKVTFLEISPPATLKERVNRLIHGVYTDIPPEYDHYGHEMRRYMAHVGHATVMNNFDELKKELSNVRKAKIILKYWREELEGEIKGIEQTIEEADAATDVRTMFKYNSGIARAFLAECGSWLDNNEGVLAFLFEKQGQYSYKDPVFKFKDREDRLKFISLYKAREKSREIINEYAPFALMVY